MTIMERFRTFILSAKQGLHLKGAWPGTAWMRIDHITIDTSNLKKSIRTAKCRVRKKRYYVLVLAPLALVGLLFLWPLLARIGWSSEQSWYELGWFGIAPVRYYKSLKLPVARIEFLQQDSRCTQQHIFLAPRGPHVENPGGMILDANGELVWRQPTLGGDTQDMRPQQYMGRTVVTLWSGRVYSGRKLGAWYMFDEDYNLVHEVMPDSPYLYGDMHDFGLTKDDTAIITLYHPVQADLTPVGGPADGWLLENVFQEINVETREVLFEWNATHHFALEDTFKEISGCNNNQYFAYGGCGYDRDTAFDFYHLNSVEKDDKGNYLISGRNLHTLSYVDGKTGDVIWNLGGLYNDFEDRSGGKATDFTWQHDARWHYNGTSISLFDNANHQYSDPNVQSRGLVLDLDVDSRTVELRQSYYHPHEMRSLSQGDVQLVEETGNVLVGWGHTPGFTEFSADGDVLCDARFGATAFASFGAITSYRVFRGDWAGRPHQPIDAVIEGLDMFVSWNGDTEIDRWQAEAAESEDGPYKAVAQVFRSGFETEIRLQPNDEHRFFRATGIHKNGTVLGTSKPFQHTVLEPWISPLVISVLVFIVFNVALVLSGSALVVRFMRWKRSRQVSRQGYEALSGAEEGDEHVLENL